MPISVRIRTIILVAIGTAIPTTAIIIAFITVLPFVVRLIIILVTILWFTGGVYLLYLLIPQWSGWLRKVRKNFEGTRIATLTFDDGPDEPWTSQVLDVLKDKGVKTTFFVLGSKAKANPDIIKRMAEENHDIGNHMMSHRKLIFRNRHKIAEEIIETSNAIASQTEALPTLFRSPHGFKSPELGRILTRLGLIMIPWTKGIWDPNETDPEALFKRFKGKFAELEILLLHDGLDASLTSKDRNATVAILPRIIDEYRQRGYEFKKISELE